MKKNLSRFALVLISISLSSLLLQAATASFIISSPAVKGSPETGFDSKLKSAGRIDSAYAAKDGDPANLKSFPISWKDLPAGTKAIAVILDDPDARLVMASFGMKGNSYLHWIATDIDPSADGLKENASADNPAFVQGKNSNGTIGYIGPQPPVNIPRDAKKPIIHIYRLTAYALSSRTGLKNGFSMENLQNAIKGKVLGEAHLNISYSN